ncbi:MAG: D-alanyl-D-alanine carboxypeptidase, partial [Pricia sp.]
LYAQNSARYFTPASNTKIFTLFTALQFLPDKVPALKYLSQNDTLYVQGTGDPSFLHPFLKDSTALKFLRQYQNITLHLNNFQEDRFGPGWSWTDYQYYYQPERSPLPLYGNVVTIFSDDTVNVKPSYFEDKVINIDYTRQRELNENIFYYGKSRRDTVEIPFKTDSTLTRILLEDALGKQISLTDKIPLGDKIDLIDGNPPKNAIKKALGNRVNLPTERKSDSAAGDQINSAGRKKSQEMDILQGIPADSLYRRMMLESDNMIAEQLLIVASSTLSDTLSSSLVRDSVLNNQLSELRQPPRWVDGSGLSRYNLFTPESIVVVLQKLYQQIPRERLFELFPAGGVSGTLENWYAGDPEPYLHAKTGSLGNNHCLSGYLVTKSGKTLIFSFMNNHFRSPSSEVKNRMQRIFEEIRDGY